ncbi:MAG: ribonuclease H-like domain-containing protein, partial [Pirellulaceae bacterium]
PQSPRAVPAAPRTLIAASTTALKEILHACRKHTTNNYLAFDVETAKVMPENEKNWRCCRPLGISCAATLLCDTDEVCLWQGADRLTQPEAAGLVAYLRDMVREGYTILTWNGTGFDFDVLAEESGMLTECQELAVQHVDMMFHILCRLGFGVSLNAAAQGMNLPGKPEGMNGAMAPVLWAEGQRATVLDYVAQDVRTTAALATACETNRELRWITKSGKARTMRLPNGWLTMEQAERLPQPNTSWMAEPWKRSDFTAWMR